MLRVRTQPQNLENAVWFLFTAFWLLLPASLRADAEHASPCEQPSSPEEIVRVGVEAKVKIPTMTWDWSPSEKDQLTQGLASALTRRLAQVPGWEAWCFTASKRTGDWIARFHIEELVKLRAVTVRLELVDPMRSEFPTEFDGEEDLWKPDEFGDGIMLGPTMASDNLTQKVWERFLTPQTVDITPALKRVPIAADRVTCPVTEGGLLILELPLRAVSPEVAGALFQVVSDFKKVRGHVEMVGNGKHETSPPLGLRPSKLLMPGYEIPIAAQVVEVDQEKVDLCKLEVVSILLAEFGLPTGARRAGGGR